MDREEKSIEVQLEDHFRDCTTDVCNLLQSCLADQFPVMDKKVRAHFLKSIKRLKRRLYDLFELDWEKGKRPSPNELGD